MYNDSIETLLLRHYGPNASAPADLEQNLVTSLRQQEAEQRWQQNVETRLRLKRVSRRRIIRLVALTSAGAGVLSVGMEILRRVEATLVGQRQDAVQTP